MAKKLLLWALSFQLVFAPAFASDPNGANSVKKAQAEQKITNDTEAWSAEKEALLPQILNAAEDLANYSDRLVAQYGEAYVEKLLEANQIHLETSDATKVGEEVTYRQIDGVRVPRLLINGEVYLVIDQSQLAMDSKHLQKYVARVHFEAGGKGRAVNLVFLNRAADSDPEFTTHYLPKPKVTSYKWWREYFISKYKKPSRSDVTLGLATGIGLHAGLAVLVGLVTGHRIPPEALSWTIAYSTVYGAFVSTIRNWTVLSGSQFTRVLKSQVVSTMFAYGLVLAVGEGDFSDRLSTISLFSLGESGMEWNAAGAAMNISIFANGIMNNFTKDFWNQIPRLRDMTRSNSGNFDFKIEWLNKITQWKKATVEGQLLYLIPWTINFLALTTLATTDWFKIPGTGISFPILQFMGIPIAMFWAKKYSRRLADRAKEDPNLKVWSAEVEAKAVAQEKLWQKTFGAPISELPGNIMEWSKDVGTAGKNLAHRCWEALTSTKRRP